MIPEPFTRERLGADALREGFFLIRRDRQSQVPLPVRIWWGAPIDPETGDELDRSPRWQVMIAGQLVDEEPLQVGRSVIRCLSDFWPVCSQHEIDQAQYQYRIDLARWAGEHDPNDPHGDTAAKIDPLTVSLPGLAA